MAEGPGSTPGPGAKMPQRTGNRAGGGVALTFRSMSSDFFRSKLRAVRRRQGVVVDSWGQ